MFHAVHLDQVMHFETSTIAGMPRNANQLESLVCHAAHVGHERANIMEPCLPNARIPPACLLRGRRRRGGSLCRLILVTVARLRDTAILMPEKKTEIPKTSEGCTRNDFKQISGRPPERCIVVSLSRMLGNSQAPLTCLGQNQIPASTISMRLKPAGGGASQGKYSMHP